MSTPKAKSGLGDKGSPPPERLDVDELQDGNKHLESRRRARAKGDDAEAENSQQQDQPPRQQ